MRTGVARWSLKALGGSLAAVLAAGSAAIGWGRYVAPDSMVLPDPVQGERFAVARRAGTLQAYAAGEGAPILLVHSINAAGSAYEVRPIFDELRRDRRVYAFDLPGFGLSDRSDRPYGIPLYVAAIQDMLDAIAERHGGAPIDVVALSLSSEFLARAAAEQPDRFRSLALVTPTGFDRSSESRRGPPGSTREVPGLYRTFTFPLWSRGFYNLLVSRPSIRFFLVKTFGSKAIDEGLLDYDYLTTHQPGARHAPYAFVSGRLFSRDSRDVYERLTSPVLVLHGTRGDFQDFSGIGWTRTRPNWRVEAFDTGALPHFERLPEFMASLRRFLGNPGAPAEPAQSSSSSPSRSPSP